ncbi:hypothetical protein [Oscillatoria sp. FACHB-1406]|uniref:hypothetical protein n=1 Tax=Oscillatoria sp. FACHB-1406 TaxID=2692846 RepID=UPI00168354AF|nr:hypothetical protein [Oscillatoria sp. FACHB-1406]MBD2580185.1 hypothetical protein [Oscillatoria sp. FACHB-1406]
MTFSIADSVAKTTVPAKSPRLLAESHRDPRGLWIAAIAISAIAHLALGWAVVRVLLVEGKANAKSQDIIRVEAVTVQPTPQVSPQSLARVETAPAPVPQSSPQTQEQRRTTPNAPAKTQPQTAAIPAPVEKKPTWRWFRSDARTGANNAPESAIADSTGNPSERRTAEQIRANRQSRSSASNSSPLINDSAPSARGDSSPTNSTVRRYGGSASGSDSIWNDSPNTSSSPRRWNSGQSNSGSPAPNNDSTSGSSSPPATETPQSQGASASLGTPRLTRPNSDVPDSLAAPLQSSQQLSKLPFGVRLEGRSVLEVTAVIEANGKATVYGTKVVSGSLSQAQAQQLGKQLVESWKFRPTYMGDRAVAQEYLIQLSLAPLVN